MEKTDRKTQQQRAQKKRSERWRMHRSSEGASERERERNRGTKATEQIFAHAYSYAHSIRAICLFSRCKIKTCIKVCNFLITTRLEWVCACAWVRVSVCVFSSLFEVNVCVCVCFAFSTSGNVQIASLDYVFIAYIMICVCVVCMEVWTDFQPKLYYSINDAYTQTHRDARSHARTHICNSRS